MNILNSSSMAGVEEIKCYIAHWFQLGKRVYSNKGEKVLLPKSVIEGGKYSEEFEECWQYILSPKSGDCYLEGTAQTVTKLLSSEWEVIPCSLCEMPIPVRIAGKGQVSCPCHDLPGWPNLELPKPRSPVNSNESLNQIQQRLKRLN